MNKPPRLKPQFNRDSRFVGVHGENLAASFLANNHGYKIIARNFKERYEEIDIIALDDDTLVFIEVKARKDNSFGLPEESITQWKIRRLIKAAQYFSLTHPRLPKLMRIDAVVIELDPNNEPTRIELIKNIVF